MGLRGPAPKPSAIERAEGYPGKRMRNTEEPQPAELTVAEVKRRCPKHLKGEERKWWRYYGELLTPLRVIAETDLVAMEALARTTTERVAQEEQLPIRAAIQDEVRLHSSEPVVQRSLNLAGA